MGYRFTLEQINLVAQLIDGNIPSVLEEMLYSKANYFANKQYLSKFLEKFNENFYTSSRGYYYNKKRESFRLHQSLKEINNNEIIIVLRNYWEEDDNQLNRLELHNIISIPEIRKLTNILRGINRLIGNSKINSMLLPGCSESRFNNYLISEELLNDLVQIHPEDSCLILQPKELLQENNVSIFNAFDNFELASNYFKDWPGLLIWNKKDAVFIPLPNDYDSGIEELNRIFSIIHFEREPLRFLKYYRNTQISEGKYSYILHLSDLHFGIDKTNKIKEYLVETIKTIQDKLDDGKIELSLVTGDLVDSPEDISYKFYNSFQKELTDKLGCKFISVFGNHDLMNKGNRILTIGKQCFNAFDTNKLIVNDELGLIIIKIDSNAEESGLFAEGKVGKTQLQDIDNELLKIQNFSDYYSIVMLHHHPVEIADPTWKKSNFIKRIFSGLLENTLKLADAEEFLNWIKGRNIKLVMHGHKHIPNIINIDNIDIIGCGSSTGNVSHIKKDLTYMTYNLIKYDNLNKKPISMTTYYVDNFNLGLKHLNTVILNEI